MQSNEIEVKTLPADHENAAAFGPCAGPHTDNTPEGDVSWACAGYGTERIDPESEEIKVVIICGRCFSLREGRVIEQAFNIMMGSAA